MYVDYICMRIKIKLLMKNEDNHFILKLITIYFQCCFSVLNLDESAMNFEV